METKQIYSQVDERYSAASRGTALEYGHAIAKAFGYSEHELADIPKESNLGLSCGNPIALASIRESETVIDLGSGAGFDAFLAASKVGPTGQVIGVDMNKDMLARAEEIKTKTNKTNVRFVHAQITDMSAIASNTADCIISNCVINLVPETEKPLVFKEIHRLLKPGGRLAVSDILAKKPLPDKLRANMALYVGCISGASLVEQYQQYLKNAGFPNESVAIKIDDADLNVYMETNADGTRITGGRGGNLCCNPTTATTPIQASSSCCSTPQAEAIPSSCFGNKSGLSSSATTSSCCSNIDASLAPVPAPTSSGGCKSNVKPDAAVAAGAKSSSPCCGEAFPTKQSCAFDEMDLADLEGEDLNLWAGKSTSSPYPRPVFLVTRA